MERRSQNHPELPNGVTIDNLRYVNPHLYALCVAQLGWEAFIGSDVDGNPAKVTYSLSRRLSGEIDLEKLKQKTGLINDNGEIFSGYKLDIVEKNGIHNLDFNFTGFPTQQTMDILTALEDEFNPEGIKPKKLKLLASSEPMDDFFDESEEKFPRKGKSLLDRVRTVFQR